MALIFRVVFITITVILLALGIINYWIIWRTTPYIYSHVTTLPAKKVGLVLGTSKYFQTGLNQLYVNRINGASLLYKANKIDYLLVSGDNAQESYNEPMHMKRDLRKLGVPSETIYLDFAGFRTLDSIIRIFKVFNTRSFTIITQRFHCERALFIAQYYQLNAQCFAVDSYTPKLSLQIRELMARLLVFSDLYIMKRQPRFLGPLISIPTPMMPVETTILIDHDSRAASH